MRSAVGLTADGRPAVKIFTASEAVRGFPSTLDGIPVVVEVTGEISAIGPTAVPDAKPAPPSVDPTAFFTRPVPIGVSTGNQSDLVYLHAFCTSGTLGARLTDVCLGVQRRDELLKTADVLPEGGSLPRQCRESL